MTIQKTTHKICKLIQKTNFRKSVKTLFDGLESNGSIVHLNSIAVELNRQFFGYAFAHQEICKQGYSLLSLEGIDVLITAHKLLLEITKCLCCLDEIPPKIQTAISPYSDCQVELSNCSVLPEIDNSGALNKALEELKQDFSKHPALKILGDCVNKLNNLDDFEENQLVEIVLNFRRRIINQGFSEADDSLRHELFARHNSRQLYLARLIRSLIILRDSISSISQFIYQSFRYEKPIILSKDNVFCHEGMNSNWFGETMFFRIQPIAREAYLWPGDFVIVSLDLGDIVEDGFYRVEKIDNLDSSDFGSSTRFSIRKLDENMVCYPQLLSD